MVSSAFRQRLRPASVFIALMLHAFTIAEPVPATAALLHPLHTSITEVVHDRAKQTLTLTVRVFAEDFLAALSSSHAARRAPLPARPGSDWRPAAIAYMAQAVAVRDERGTSLALLPCGIQEAGEVLLICARVNAVADVRGFQIRNAILFEKFEDQLSIVRVTARDRTQTFILSSKSDAARVR